MRRAPIHTMTELHKKFQEAFDDYRCMEINDKMKFLEELLFYFTLTGRSIWSDPELSDAKKVNGLTWLNELSHRIWIIKSGLQQGNAVGSVETLYGQLKFHSEQSEILRPHLAPSFVGAYEKYKRIN